MMAAGLAIAIIAGGFVVSFLDVFVGWLTRYKPDAYERESHKRLMGELSNHKGNEET